jgi:hypothetical protein
LGDLIIKKNPKILTLFPTNNMVTYLGRSYPKMKCTQICLKVSLPHLAEVALWQGTGGLGPPEALG